MEKTNPYIYMGVVDKEFNLFTIKDIDKHSKSNIIKKDKNYNTGETCVDFIADIPEFVNKIKLIAEGSIVVMDEMYFESNGYKPIGYSSIIVCDDKLTVRKRLNKIPKKSTFINFDELKSFLVSQKGYRPILFLGQHKLIEKLKMDSIMFAVCDIKYFDVISKFPIKLFNRYIKTKTTSLPSTINQNLINSSKSFNNYTVLANGMKLIESVKDDINEDLPPYHFLDLNLH